MMDLIVPKLGAQRLADGQTQAATGAGPMVVVAPRIVLSLVEIAKRITTAPATRFVSFGQIGKCVMIGGWAANAVISVQKT